MEGELTKWRCSLCPSFSMLNNIIGRPYCQTSFFLHFFPFWFYFKDLRTVYQPIAQVYGRSVDESSAIVDLSTVCLVDVSEKMELRANFLYFLEQALTASILIVDCLV